jgi:acyl-CoA reductase-like NAD-dependent aldehyde dehydrogenase
MHLKTIVADNELDIANKIDMAVAAQRGWAYSTFPERRRVMKSLKRWLVENQDVCARVACRDTGKTCKPDIFFQQLHGTPTQYCQLLMQLWEKS